MGTIAEDVAAHGGFYHTFDLPGGVVTRGYFDYRRFASKLSMPASLAGKRCLDVAASEGFWTFEMRRRGAEHVVSLDLPDTTEQDWQAADGGEWADGTGRANRGFAIVQRALGTTGIERIDLNVYDMDPALLGTFDFVFMGNILIHLAEPARALRAVRSVLRPDGQMFSLEPISLLLTALTRRVPLGQLWDHDEQPRWWTPNLAGYRRLLHTGGLDVVRSGGPLFQPFGELVPRRPERFRLRPRELMFWGLVRPFGVPSAWAVCRPSV